MKLYLEDDDLTEIIVSVSEFDELCERLKAKEISFPNTPNYVIEDLQSALLDLISELNSN